MNTAMRHIISNQNSLATKNVDTSSRATFTDTTTTIYAAAERLINKYSNKPAGGRSHSVIHNISTGNGPQDPFVRKNDGGGEIMVSRFAFRVVGRKK